MPIQLLWLNLVTNGLQDIALSLEKPEPNIMRECPRSTKESLFTKSMVSQCLIMGLFIGLIVFVAWLILTTIVKTDIVVARSMVMALMVFLQNIHAFNCRSEKESIFKMSFVSNWFFVVSIGLSIGLQILFMEVGPLSVLLELTPVSYISMFALLGISLSIILCCEIYKLIIRKRCKKQKKA